MNKPLLKVCLILSFLTINLICTASASDYIDLTYTFNKDTPLFPGRYSTFNVELEGYTANDIWVASKGFCISEHTSTHIDAPYHFNKDGWTLDKIPLENLLDVNGVMIDIYDKVHKFENGELKVIENYALTRQDILEWEKANGIIPPRSVILLRTGWSNRWDNKRLYLGQEEESKENVVDSKEEGKEAPSIDLNVKVNFPGFDGSAASFLVNERQALAAGIDCLSVDIGNTQTFPMHVIFTGRNKYLLENVANLHLLPPQGFKLWIVPFKVDRGTGAPARVLAKVNSH